MNWLWKLLGLWCEEHQCRFRRYMGIGSGPGAVDWDWNCPIHVQIGLEEELAYIDRTDQEIFDQLRDAK